ncbi:MAG: hypothetical protein QOF84_7410 [Streptomyces sp.]|jgi:DNA-binding MarR family transcriptional regulator|nr:hypothetical protein [Streptomyces sp.]
MSADREDVSSRQRAVMRELLQLSRRFRAHAHHLHPELTLPAHAVLAQLASRGRQQAGDLVGMLGVSKSTVSRELSDLQRSGLVTRSLDRYDNRIQVVDITERGREVLEQSDRRMTAQVARRTRDWRPEEIQAFHALLRRYNEGGSPAT